MEIGIMVDLIGNIRNRVRVLITSKTEGHSQELSTAKHNKHQGGTQKLQD